MNILHINYTDLAGGRFTGLYMNSVNENDVKIEIAVWNKKSDYTRVKLLPPKNKFIHFILNKFMLFASRLSFDGLLGSSGFLIENEDYFKKADVIHIHLIHGFSNFSILSLPRISRLKPVVWTLHDKWALTGGCEHSFECNKWINGCNLNCPHPRSKSIFNKQAPFFHWKIKKWIYSKINLNIVVASDWMNENVKKSSLLNHLPRKIIPFGIDIEKFKKKKNIDYKLIFGIPKLNKVIAFRNPGLKNDKFKGMKWLKKSLDLYEPDTPITLLIFEKLEGFEHLTKKYHVINLGWIDGEKLIQALCAADIFLMPSIQESFGLMAVEAMACETPVIVFDKTALPGVIKGGGLSVEYKNSEKLKEAIQLLLDDSKLRRKISQDARILVEQKYNYSLYINRHIDLYKKALDKKQ